VTRRRSRRGQGQSNVAWYAMDLHVHTPASKDYVDEGVAFLDILQKAEAEGLDIIGFTDHNTVAGYARMMEEIEDLERWERDQRLRPEEKQQLDEYRRLMDKILVLPGFELTATFGFHVLALFDPDTNIRRLEHVLLDLNVPLASLDRGETEVGSTSDVLTAYETMAEAGALVIAAHANSTHGVAMFGMNFGGQTRIAYTQDPNLHALEVTDLEARHRRTTASFFNGSKAQYPRRMHCIQGSDAHRLRGQGKNPGVGERATEVQLPELSFEALKALFLSEDFARTRPYREKEEETLDLVEEARKQGPTISQSFHENMTRRGGCLHAIMCDMVAFANTNGGTLYVGLTANQRVKPKGVENPSQAIKLLREDAERMITPPIEVKMDAISSQGAQIIRIEVPQGEDKPYVMEGSKIYIRHEAETSLAMRDEIVDLVKRVVVAEEPKPRSRRERAPEPRERAPQPARARQAEQPRQAPPQEAQQPARQEPRNAEVVQEPSPASMPERSNGGGAVEPPNTGVEIDETVVRKGVQYHTMRDLRDGGRVHNVTRSSARRLWRYAIALKEKGTFSEDKVEWNGDLGLWHKYLRSGRPHYDLVQRTKDGEVRVYYGVSEDGIHGPWQQVVTKQE
jgi:PHP family Zn ribbon phosphoesterase